MKPAHTPQCPSLPPELWIRILTFNTDLTHLWTQCRHTSHAFRAYTEQVFAHHVLRNTHIDFHLEKYNLGGKSKRPEIPTSFARFEEASVSVPHNPNNNDDDGNDDGDGDDTNAPPPKQNKPHATFADTRPKKSISGGKTSEYTRIMQRWALNIHTLKPQMPNYTIRIHCPSSSTTPLLINDTALPSLTHSPQSRSITFDWRGMYTLFFREQALFLSLKRKWERASAAAAEVKRSDDNDDDARSADDKPSSVQNIQNANAKESPQHHHQSWSTASLELRKQIRRKRLATYYKGDEEMEWAIGSLSRFEDHGGGGSGGAVASFKLNPDLPGAGLGERWFGSVNLVRELFLDEWSCLHRIETKGEHVKGDGGGGL